jgi:hypothetical protein
MMISEPLTWLCEEPRHSLIANRIVRKGWPDLANFFLLPRPLELGELCRKNDLLGRIGVSLYYGGVRGGSQGTKAVLTDALELVEAISLSGEAVNLALKMAECLHTAWTGS